MSKGYITIKMPKELMDKVDELIETANFGFKSRGEFAKEAIRKLLHEYKEA